MKKLTRLAAILASTAILFSAISCKTDDSGGGGEESGPSIETNADGTTTLKIEENGKGFVSTTGSINTTEAKWIGYSGGFVENLTIGTSVIYAVKVDSDISDAKIAIHYANWQNTNVRGAYVYVNGTLVNENNPISMTYTQGQTVSDRWIDTGFLTGISLKAGTNKIELKGAPEGSYENFIPTAKDTANNLPLLAVNNDGQLSNIDYLIVNGKGISFGNSSDVKSSYKFYVSSENETAGSVTSSAANGSVEEDTSVTLNALANSGWKFECWTDGNTSAERVINVSKNTYLMAHFVPENYVVPSGLVGYASVTTDNGDSYTITGGAGAASENVVTVSSYDELIAKKELLASDTPAIFTIKGKISTAGQSNPLLSVKLTVGSNTTIYGDITEQGRLQNIELCVEGENVIIRNMMLGEVISWDGYARSGADDALSLNGATHVWIDHCEFQSHLTPQDLDGNEIKSGNNYYSSDEDWKKDFYDGLLDIKNGSTWITVSNCYFHDHWKAVLCASGDEKPDANTTTGATDEDMRVTFAGNYFKNVNARMPLFRYGKGHILNTYFDAGTQSDSASCINVRAGSELYIEGNNFANFTKTTGDSVVNGSYLIGFYFADAAKTYGNASGKWKAVNNSSDNGGSSSYKPPYEYTAPGSAVSEPTPGVNVGVNVLTASDLQ
ncbi:pectate lyase family protein [Treponema sp. UBA7570]|uniref:pectate lyase family protein n=1 Tax=Treponema sp. UBA7570 TaxID=1947749 RepID=UPI0025F0AA99|nr:polysaccharide lyase family 1 protein [Treponema sp. UBA7570]